MGVWVITGSFSRQKFVGAVVDATDKISGTVGIFVAVTIENIARSCVHTTGVVMFTIAPSLVGFGKLVTFVAFKSVMAMLISVAIVDA